MKVRSAFFPTIILVAAVAAGFAAGVLSAPARDNTCSAYRFADNGAPADDYFPGRYVNRASGIEALPAQF